MQKRRSPPRQARIEGMAAEILDVGGAARLLGVSKRTIYKLASDQAIPAAKVGREWRFSRKRLTEWVTEGTRTSPPGSRRAPAKRQRAGSPSAGIADSNEAGRGFRFEAGHDSELKPAAVPI